ncbi:hypothetical protein BC938DRAFT_471142 [Jimgerdemannia flammicorona]|uniref:Uncharacterized protein n=1 Tax=Jimgerdemannia flammicorona TaxID=994334 RepID=A0A433QUU1_9FUNG|nr:hypothetical protein BC938DRAFT_471142 [Jimgerdemannia flammicorona]
MHCPRGPLSWSRTPPPTLRFIAPTAPPSACLMAKAHFGTGELAHMTQCYFGIDVVEHHQRHRPDLWHPSRRPYGVRYHMPVRDWPCHIHSRIWREEGFLSWYS